MTRAKVAASRVVFEVCLNRDRKRGAQRPNIESKGSCEWRSVDKAAMVGEQVLSHLDIVAEGGDRSPHYHR